MQARVDITVGSIARWMASESRFWKVTVSGRVTDAGRPRPSLIQRFGDGFDDRHVVSSDNREPRRRRSLDTSSPRRLARRTRSG
ncbi:hypothetical protein C8039_01190 [Halogeometricum sp. wsp3]|nr:hypothetical protein C8039_01190 [Halogeometricum sp. wsp3]